MAAGLPVTFAAYTRRRSREAAATGSAWSLRTTVEMDENRPGFATVARPLQVFRTTVLIKLITG
ncbi:hypothetical protein Acsp01_36560 [Actinoplanes sp. NBRC 101535]|nr:hypothetical protein Acsp01_36560 [Actinoplanes sp. NBRC 101535]